VHEFLLRLYVEFEYKKEEEEDEEEDLLLMFFSKDISCLADSLSDRI